MKRKDWTDEKLFERLLTNRTKSTYWENISELRSRPNQYVFDRAVELIKTGNDKEKTIGIDVLAQLGFNPRFNQKETVKLYFDLVQKEQNEMVLIKILYGISHNNENLTKHQVSKIISFKDHKNAWVREALVNALCGIEHNIAIETLIFLSKDKMAYVRDWATFGLGTQIETDNDRIRKALWKQINDSSEAVRHEAIAGLAVRKDKGIKKVLIEELKKIDEFGSLILESIEEYNDSDFIELIEKQIEINKKSRQVNEEWLMDTLEVLKSKVK
jgi:HEAT repeat protein